MITYHNEFYKPADIAKKIGVTRQKVYNEIRTGRLDCVRIGNAVRVTDKQLNKYLNGGQDDE